MKQPQPNQLDLFEWADRRPCAEVISIIPGVVRRIFRERGQPRIDRGGQLVALEVRQEERRAS